MIRIPDENIFFFSRSQLSMLMESVANISWAILRDANLPKLVFFLSITHIDFLGADQKALTKSFKMSSFKRLTKRLSISFYSQTGLRSWQVDLISAPKNLLYIQSIVYCRSLFSLTDFILHQQQDEKKIHLDLISQKHLIITMSKHPQLIAAKTKFK